MTKVLLVQRDGAVRAMAEGGGYDPPLAVPMAAALESAGFEVTAVSVARAAIRLVETRLYSVVVCEHELGEMIGTDFLTRAAGAAPGIGLLLVASAEELRTAREPSIRDTSTRRASETKVPGMRVLLRPFEAEQLVATVTHLARMAQMRRSTHAMSSIVAPKPEDDPPSSTVVPFDRPRSLFPRKS